MPTSWAMARWNGMRYESVADVVWSVIPAAVESVLPLIRPSPGKC